MRRIWKESVTGPDQSKIQHFYTGHKGSAACPQGFASVLFAPGAAAVSHFSVGRITVKLTHF